RTKILAETISALPDFTINPSLVQTNIAIFEVMSGTKSAPDYADELSREGIKMIAFSSKKLRAVTHLDIDDSDIDFVIEKLKKLYRS
ncbi:MAG: low specificity L-threonine aldolase, partial [Calditrichaceae bacterium]